MVFQVIYSLYPLPMILDTYIYVIFYCWFRNSFNKKIGQLFLFVVDDLGLNRLIVGLIDCHCLFLLMKTTVDEIHKGQFEFFRRSNYQFLLVLAIYIYIYSYCSYILIGTFKIGSNRQKLNVAPNRIPNRIIIFNYKQI